jgi:Ras-related protein Rab-7A
MFDVNDPNTLLALNKWWAEFKDRAPLGDDEVAEFCCVVVGNKVDLAQVDLVEARATEATKLIDELVPPEDSPQEYSSEEPTPIDIRRHQVSHSRSRSRSLLRGATVSTLRSGFTSFHSTSSSIFDDFESARSSPVPPSRSPSPPKPVMLSSSPGSKYVKRNASSSSVSSSAPTITPSLFARTHRPLPSISQQQVLPAIITDSTTLDRRPKLFFTSAKTGEGVSDVFEYIARRVTKRWEYNEGVEARTMHMRDYTTDTIELGLHSEGRYRGNICCS